MRGFKRCRHCGDPSFTVQQRPGLSVWLCAECNVDVRTSNVKQVPVQPREQSDRYAQLAARHGL